MLVCHVVGHSRPTSVAFAFVFVLYIGIVFTTRKQLSKFVQEVAKCSKGPHLPKTLYQFVCGIRRFMVEKNPAIEYNPFASSDKRFAIFRRILDAEMRDGTRAGVGLKAKQKDKELVTDVTAVARCSI